MLSFDNFEVPLNLKNFDEYNPLLGRVETLFSQEIRCFSGDTTINEQLVSFDRYGKVLTIKSEKKELNTSLLKYDVKRRIEITYSYCPNSIKVKENTNGILTAVYTMYLNSIGQVTHSEFFEYEKGQPILLFKTEFEYSHDKIHVKKVFTRPDLSSNQFTNIYDINFCPIREYSTKGQFLSRGRTIYKYENDGTFTICGKDNGELLTIGKSDSYGNWVEMRNYINGNSRMVVSRSITYYEDSDNNASQDKQIEYDYFQGHQVLCNNQEYPKTFSDWTAYWSNKYLEYSSNNWEDGSDDDTEETFYVAKYKFVFKDDMEMAINEIRANSLLLGSKLGKSFYVDEEDISTLCINGDFIALPLAIKICKHFGGELVFWDERWFHRAPEYDGVYFRQTKIDNIEKIMSFSEWSSYWSDKLFNIFEAWKSDERYIKEDDEYKLYITMYCFKSTEKLEKAYHEIQIVSNILRDELKDYGLISDYVVKGNDSVLIHRRCPALPLVIKICTQYGGMRYGWADEWFKPAPYFNGIYLRPEPKNTNTNNGGCYIATCVYGSYDCPEVWALRRFRDFTLAKTWYGNAFVKLYYATSPTLVKWFGESPWFKNLFRRPLDKIVAKLKESGVKDTFYRDNN